jgi:hypothetical protein
VSSSMEAIPASSESALTTPSGFPACEQQPAAAVHAADAGPWLCRDL